MNNLKKNIWKLYIIKGLMWFMLAMPIIIIFFQENGLSLMEIMILQGTYSLMIAFMEIPSGYFADKYGRKKTLLFGTIFCFIGFIFFSFSYTFFSFLIAEILLGLGNSFISGSDSAILYDTLIEINQKDQYTKIEGKTYSVGNFSEATAGIIGGFLAEISLRYPWYLQVIIAGLAIPFAYSIIEPKIKIVNNNLNNIFKVFKHTIWENKQLKWLIFFSAITGFATLSIAWFSQPFFKEIGIPIKIFGIIWALLNITVGLSSYNAHHLENLFNKTSILIITGLGISFSFGLLSLSNTKFGIFWIFIIYLIRGLATPILRNYINEITSSNIRATVLSIRSFIIRIIFAVFAPLLGWISDTYSLQDCFIILGITVGVISIICIRKIKLVNN